MFEGGGFAVLETGTEALIAEEAVCFARHLAGVRCNFRDARAYALKRMARYRQVPARMDLIKRPAEGVVRLTY